VYRLSTPLSRTDITKLNLGDIVYLTGTVFTIRDLSHQRIAAYLKEGRKEEIPFELNDGAIFHCGPIVRTTGTGDWQAISAGPTSSSRFSPFVAPLLLGMGARLIIGKGFLTPEAITGLVARGAAYVQAVGGCAALYGARIKTVANRYWPEFGMVDAVWEFEVEEFGPLSVEIDCHGTASYDRLRKTTLRRNLPRVYAKLGLDLGSDFVWWPRAIAGTKTAIKYATSGDEPSPDC
jgi:fumarate hydratase subunit beta